MLTFDRQLMRPYDGRKHALLVQRVCVVSWAANSNEKLRVEFVVFRCRQHDSGTVSAPHSHSFAMV